MSSESWAAPDALLREANRLSWLGNWERARPLYEEAELAFGQAGNAKQEAYARIGRIRAQGFERSLQVTSEQLGNELRTQVVISDEHLRLWCLANKGYVDLDVDTAASKKNWTEALQLARSLGNRQWAARAEGELGVIAFLDGNTWNAVSLVGKALLGAFTTGDVGEQVRLLSMLGHGYNAVKRYKEALWFFQHATSIAERTKDIGFPFMAYEGQATALTGLMDSEAAIKVLSQALSTAKSQDRREEVAEVLKLLGETNLRAGRTDAAIASFEAAGSIAQDGSYYRPLADAMIDLSALYRSQGQLGAAARALSVGVRASRRLGDKFSLPRDLAALGEQKAAENNVAEADKLFESAEEAMESIFANAHSSVASRAMTEAMSHIYFEHFSLAERQDDVALGLRVLERIRSHRLGVGVYRGAHGGLKSAAASELESKIASLQLVLLQTENQDTRSALLDELSQFERNLAYEQNEADLGRQELLYRTASLKDIQRSLHDDELLAEYALLDSESFCLIVTNQQAKIISLGRGRRQIAELVKSYTSKLRANDYDVSEGHQLFTLLVKPILPYGKARLIISPDTVLQTLPFEALIDQRGQYLLKSSIVTYVPSSSTIWTQRASAPRTNPTRPLLALGGVDYQYARVPNKSVATSWASSILRGLEGLVDSSLVDLPETREEVISIGKLAGPESKLLLGKEATESIFKSQPLGEFRIIHLAVHAVADSEYPERASLLLGLDRSTSDDGFLQVREIMRLHLNAELVTLSACETGVAGEAGVFSLEEAFLISGAKSVVAALWNVEDRSTTELMERFYSHMAIGESKESALRNAKLDFLERHRTVSPFQWAGFVMNGDGYDPISLQ